MYRQANVWMREYADMRIREWTGTSIRTEIVEFYFTA
jgi:hypothetical protein